MTDPRDEKVEQVIREFIGDPVLAHRTLFRHRHPQSSAPFHPTLITRFHDMRLPRVLAMIFRGGAKSTIGEETVIVKACTRQFKNCLIIGENEDRAKERLRSIRHEFETNEWIEQLFGSLKGATWGETKIELSTNVMIQAYGRGQSLRGAKHLDQRPDFVICDDLEDQESVLTEGSRKKVSDWYWQVLIPGLDSPTRTPIRVLATPLHDEALAVRLAKLDEFSVTKIPIERVDAATGIRVSSWASRFPSEEIDALRRNFAEAGNADLFESEYMCEVGDVRQKVFTPGMMKHDATVVCIHNPVYAIYDPARTVNAKSAMTGKVVASWIRNRLIVWEASGNLWKPDEIINDVFETDDKYRPVAIGIEEDGLNEFILQPLRHAQVNRGHPVPIRPLKAPKGKFDFISSLQPYFKAGEVVLAGPEGGFKDLVSQLLNFRPGYSGRVDVPNALAYFLKIRPGLPVYDGFGVENIAEDLHVERSGTYCVLHTGHGYLVGVLCQYAGGRCSVIADYLREGDAAVEIERLVGQARLDAVGSGVAVRFVAHPSHFDAYDRVGLRAGAAREGIRIERGGDDTQGRAEIAKLLSTRVGQVPGLRVSTSAGWILRAMQGGYSRSMKKDGSFSQDPEESVYATVMHALESFVALSGGSILGDDKNVRYEYTEDGRAFISARA